MKCIAMGKYAPASIRPALADPQARVAAVKALVEGCGGTWLDGFFTRGAYDFAFVCEMPNDEAVAAMYAVVYSTGVVEGISIHTEMDIDAVAAVAHGAMASYTPPS